MRCQRCHFLIFILAPSLCLALSIAPIALSVDTCPSSETSTCAETITMSKQGLSPLDPSSFARPEDVIVKNMHMVLDVDFNRKIVGGSIQLTVNQINPEAKQLILDSKSLNISSIVDAGSNEELTFTISDTVPEFGSKLSINLPDDGESKRIINITYETGSEASGLQWMTPEQTAGKVHPFMYSQFQPIHARSMIPCQDTPSVKTPYTAEITAPSALTVLMSALRGEKSTKGDRSTYLFHQNVPMPSYLIAIVAGALESRQLGPRSHVWAEKDVVEKAAFEFSETETQLKTAEEICGPYVWGIYDLLVLPPSFPFGGMENPCITFVTPTLLAGDRSLATVVAHEISHSWTGNLVTNRNFEHFWLNEGFTMFIERKILGRLTSKENEDFAAAAGANSLQETVTLFGETNPLTSLVVNLKGVHPDDAFSTVPYEKGYIFLRYLQNVVGGCEKMEAFLRKYFDEFKYKSIDSNDFKNYFMNHFSSDAANVAKIDWDRWLNAPGMPTEMPAYNKSLAAVCDELRDRWTKWERRSRADDGAFSANDTAAFTTLQKISFFSGLLKLDDFPLDKVQAMEQAYRMKDARNAEIRFVWLRLCIKVRWEQKIEDALQMVTEIGRMKYTRPLYRDLYAWPAARPLAIANFEANRKNMMHVSAYTIAKDLHLTE